MSRAGVFSRTAAVSVAALLVSAPLGFTQSMGEVAPLSGPAAVRGTDKAALDYALAVKRRAQSSSLDVLERFGQEALKAPSPDSLRRLQHVVHIQAEQRDFERASEWNRRLLAMAGQLGHSHYEEVAAINALMISHLRDANVSEAKADEVLKNASDGLPYYSASVLKARILIDDLRSASALPILLGALRSLPPGDERFTEVEVVLWNHMGLVYAQMDDVPDYLTAMKWAESHMAVSGFPWPDYEGIFNLSVILAYVGRYDEAFQVMQTYEELAKRTNTPQRRSSAGSLCGYVGILRDDWATVLKCYERFGPDLPVDMPMSNGLLNRRTVAYARTGNLALAQRDLREVRRRIDNGLMPFSPSVQRAEAEVMIASGDYRRGIAALRNYYLTQERTSSQYTSAVISDIIVDVDDQLNDARALSRQHASTITTQRWMLGAIAVLALGSTLLLLRQRRMACALSRANQREREEAARRNQFFADVSHEIRTPLNGVVAMADALRKEQLAPDVAEKVRLIATSSEMLNRLLSDVLDNAKMEAGELSIATQPFDLAQLVRDVESLWRSKAEAKDVALWLQSDLGESHWVKGDAVRLSEVLNNLISNALKFTPEGRILINVVNLANGRCLFVVTDTGIGFDEEEEGQIFERYRQADRSIYNRFGGTGLGLSISSKLVGMMGGRLNAASKKGQGAQFWFDLPLPLIDAPEVPEDGAEPVAVSRLEGGEPLRVLIVDDNATNRTIVGLLLDGDQYQLHYASNGQEAVEMASNLSFDVILMDVQMPVMNGLEAIGHIRAFEAATQAVPAAIVVFSANDSPEDRKRGIEAGADGHIAKPIVLDHLLEAINSAIQIRASQLPSGQSSGRSSDIMNAELN